MKLNYLWYGTPGHPIHPPLTDATIGAYTFAAVAALADVIGLSEHAAAHGWWLALGFGLVTTAATALTGLLDWLRIQSGTPLKRTATAHALVMVGATVFFLLAFVLGKDSFDDGDVAALPFVLTAIGFAVLTAGGMIGGSITYVHGMRVLNLVDEPTRRAITPVPHEEKERAEG